MSFHIMGNIIGFHFFYYFIIITLSIGNSGRGLSTASMPADRAQANQGVGKIPKPRSGKDTQTKEWERYPNQGVGKIPKPILAFLQDPPARKHGESAAENGQQAKQVRDQASHSRKQQTARPQCAH